MVNLLSKLFRKKDRSDTTGGMEDYMTLIRVCLQLAITARLGISNLRMLPDFRTLRITSHAPTVNNKPGVGEKARCKNMLKEMYHTNDLFFKEIDQSIRKSCRRLEDVQPYLLQFQGFTQELMMPVGNLMKFKLRMPSIFKSVLYTVTKKTVDDIFTKNDYKDAGVIKAAVVVRRYNKRLGSSQKWTTDFIHQVAMLVKREPRPGNESQK